MDGAVAPFIHQLQQQPVLGGKRGQVAVFPPVRAFLIQIRQQLPLQGMFGSGQIHPHRGGQQLVLHRENLQLGGVFVQRAPGFKVVPNDLQRVDDLPVAGGVFGVGDGTRPLQIAQPGPRHGADALRPEVEPGAGGQILKPQPPGEAEAARKETAPPELVAGAGQLQKKPGIIGKRKIALFAAALLVIQAAAGLADAEIIKNQNVAGLPQLLQHLLHSAGRQTVVAVQKEQVFALCGLDAGVPGGAQAAVRLVEHPDQAGMAPGVVFRDLSGAVGRAVVHHDDLIVLPAGENRGIQTGGQVVLHPVNGDHDTELWHGISPPGHCTIGRPPLQACKKEL